MYEIVFHNDESYYSRLFFLLSLLVLSLSDNKLWVAAGARYEPSKK